MRSSAERRGRGATALRALGAAAAIVALAAPASARANGDLYFRACGTATQNIFFPYTQSGWRAGVACPTPGGSPTSGIWLTNPSRTSGGSVAHWEADAPAGIELNGVYTNAYSISNPSSYFNEYFYWQGGSSGYLRNLNMGSAPYSTTFPSSSYFGWQISCNATVDCSNSAFFNVYNISLSARETVAPSITADFPSNLWYQGGHWIRGSFPIQLEAADPSGVCQVVLTWDGQSSAEPEAARVPNQNYWNQCDPGAPPLAAQYFFSGKSIDTTAVAPQSAMGVPLQISATNAAANTSTVAETLNIDNSTPTLSLSGPVDAPSTAGTQYVSATATAGPSGVGAIDCSIDGSPWTSEPLQGEGTGQAHATIPLAGLGEHTVSCRALNRSYDATGAAAASATRGWSLKIGAPVGAGISFGRVIERCRRVTKRVKLPGRWVTVHRHHRWMRVRRPGGTRIERVLSCHALTPDRRLERVRFGHPVTVSGWLAAQGVALSHVPVRIETALDDGSGRWRTAAVALTSADGRWTAKLKPGPSRLIQAVYDGGPTTLASASPTATVLVGARIVLTALPTHIPWGGVLVVRGRVLGGHIPHEQILQMLSGSGRHLQVIGNPLIRPDGRFQIRLAATGSGGAVRTQIAVATLRETNYPYARGISRRVWVTLG